MNKKYDKAFWILFSILFLIRLLSTAKFELFSDEAFYWLHSKFPAICYQFNPPIYSYLIKFFTLLFGNSEFAVRLMSLTSWVGLTIILYLFSSKIANKRVAFYSVLVINLLPVFIPVGFITIPDMPFLFFWMLTIFYLWKIFGKDSPSPSLWYMAGISLGFGLMSKYFMVLLIPCVFIYLILSPKNNYWLKRKEPYIALSIAFFMMSPAILWNIVTKLDSIALHFKGRHTIEKIPLVGNKFLFYIVSQSAIITPIIFLLVIAALIYAIITGVRNKRDNLLFLALTSAPVLLFFAGWALFIKVKPHWTCYSYFTSVILLIILMDNVYLSLKKKPARFLLILPFVVTFIPILLTLFIVLSTVNGYLKYLPLPASVKSYLRVRFDFVPDMWSKSGQYINEVYEDLSQDSKGVFIFGAREYITISLAAYYTKRPFQAYLFEPLIVAEQFLYWQKPERLKKIEGFNAVAVGKPWHFEDCDLNEYFSYIEEVKPLEFVTKGKSKKKLLVYRCYGFKASSLNQ